MLHKYPNIVPIPGSKNQERILENLAAWNVVLTDEEFAALDSELNVLNIKCFRGHVEFQGGSMADWGQAQALRGATAQRPAQRLNPVRCRSL